MPRILVVDDEPRIVEVLKAYLQREGFQVVSAADGAAALEEFRRQSPDLIILDLMLPGVDGLEVCRTVRRDSQVPIIMVTARGEDVDKLIGLELGADDYITKPFSPREVVARVKAVLRRTHPPPPLEQIVRGELVLDFARHEVRCHGEEIALTPTEFKLLAVLAQDPGRVFTRLQLLDQVLGEAYEGYDRTIDTHIKNLRQKLGQLSPGSGGRQHKGCRIATVHGVGYKLEG